MLTGLGVRAGKLTEGMGLAASLQMSDGAPLFSPGLTQLHKDGAALDPASLAQAFRQGLLPKDGQAPEGLRGSGRPPGGAPLHPAGSTAAPLSVHLHGAPRVHARPAWPGVLWGGRKRHRLVAGGRRSLLRGCQALQGCGAWGGEAARQAWHNTAKSVVLVCRWEGPSIPRPSRRPVRPPQEAPARLFMQPSSILRSASVALCWLCNKSGLVCPEAARVLKQVHACPARVCASSGSKLGLAVSEALCPFPELCRSPGTLLCLHTRFLPQVKLSPPCGIHSRARQQQPHLS